MIGEDEFHHRPAGIHHPRGVSANDSAFITFRDTGGREVPASLNLHDANPAAARLVFNIQIIKSHVAQGRDIYPQLAVPH